MLSRRQKDQNEEARDIHAPDLDESPWHRLQRSWPFVRMMPAVGSLDKHGRGPLLATNPCFPGPYFAAHTWATLETVKQGSYQGRPATFLRVDVAHYEWARMQANVIDIRLQRRSAESSSDFEIVACGPGNVTRPGMLEPGRALPPALWRRIQSTIDKHYATVTITGCKALELGLPHSFAFGMLVVHDQPVTLTLSRSADVKTRMTVLKRAKVYPLTVDMGTELRVPITTCGKAHGEACTESCHDLGPQHMTAARWRELLRCSTGSGSSGLFPTRLKHG